MSLNLDNSIPFDVYKTSKYPEIKELNNSLFDELINQNLYSRQPRSRNLIRAKAHLRTVLLNLYYANAIDRGLFVGYSRSEGDYHQNSRYNKLFISYSILIRVIDKLVELKYIEDHIGFHDRNSGNGRQSRMRASNKLLKLFQCNPIMPEMIERDYSKEEVIILKDKDKNRIEYIDTLDTKRLRKNLKRINYSLDNAFVGLCISDKHLEKLRKKLSIEDGRLPVDIRNKRLTRIFNNGSFEEGGRFYGGWWQNIPRKYRKFIVIGYLNDNSFNQDDIFNQRVVELDYKSHHARMLYKKIGINLRTKDPFKFSDFDPRTRSIFKEAFYTMLNASSRSEARGAIHISLVRNQKPASRGLTAENIVSTIEERRRRISRYI